MPLVNVITATAAALTIATAEPEPAPIETRVVIVERAPIEHERKSAGVYVGIRRFIEQEARAGDPWAQPEARRTPVVDGGGD